MKQKRILYRARLTVKSLLTLIAEGEPLLLLVAVLLAEVVVDEGSESELTVFDTMLFFFCVEGVDVEET